MLPSANGEITSSSTGSSSAFRSLSSEVPSCSLSNFLSPSRQDIFDRPIASSPDAWIDVVERYKDEKTKLLK